MLQKLSLLNSNGTINDEAALELLKKTSDQQPTHKPAATRVAEKCLNGQYLKYAPKQVCGPVKYFACGYINIMMVSYFIFLTPTRVNLSNVRVDTVDMYIIQLP